MLMKRFFTFALLALSLVGCKSTPALLPTVSGKAGEVLVVIEKNDWDSQLGESVRGVLADEYPFLPVQEARYSVSNVSHGGFIEMFQVHRNIVFFDITPQAASTGVKFIKDKWATPQCLVLVSAYTAEMADSLFRDKAELIIETIEQAERERVITNTRKYENKSVYPAVSKVFGGSVHVPSGYKLAKITDDFAWIQDKKQYTTQGIFVYRYPVGEDDFTMENLVKNRNRMLKANVPGMFEGTYMVTGTYWTPQTRYLKYKGRDFAETHGMWEVEGDFMGGPFVSHAFYSPDGKYIVVADAWVYAPKFDKRQYLRQTESLLYTWEWNIEK